MSDYQVFWYLLGGIFGVLCGISYMLWRIYRVLLKIADGDPTSEELRNVEFRKIRFK